LVQNRVMEESGRPRLPWKQEIRMFESCLPDYDVV
jgi:hypothetical protein